MDQLEQLKEYMNEGKYDMAVALLPSIKERSVKSASDLMLMAKAYSKCADFVHVEKLFKRAYKIRPSKLLYRDMIELCIECGDTDAAEEYLEQYSVLSPGDTLNCNILAYKIQRKIDAEPKVLIGILEEIKQEDYMPEWAYELAKQYHKANMKNECIAELEKIVSTFDPEAGVVVKSKTLLSYYRGEISAEEIKSRGKKREAKAHEEQAAEKPAAESNDASEPNDASESNDASEPNDAPMPDADSEVNDVSEENNVQESQDDVSEPAIEDKPEEIPAEPAEEASEDDEEEAPKKDAEDYIAEADSEIIEQLEDEKLAKEKELLKEKEKEKIPLYAPKFVLNQDDLKESKAKRVIVKNQINLEEVCKNYFRIGSLRHQIFNCLDLAVIERDRLYLCITGEPGTGRTTLAARLVRLLFLMGVLKNDRLAKVDGSKLDAGAVSSLRKTLKKYNVLIENAGLLDAHCAEVLAEEAADRKSGTCVVLEDNSRSINELFRNATAIRELATNRIHITKFDAEELVGFAYDICRENEYQLSQEAADRLCEALKKNRGGEAARFAYVINTINKAVYDADRRYAPGILKMAASAAFSEDYSLVLTEEDLTL